MELENIIGTDGKWEITLDGSQLPALILAWIEEWIKQPQEGSSKNC